MSIIKQPLGLYETQGNTKYVMDRGSVELLMCLLNGVEPDGTIITTGIFKDIFLNSDLNSDVIQAIYSIKRYPFDVLKAEEIPGTPGSYGGFIGGQTGSGDKLDPYNTSASLLKAISIANKTSTVKGTLDGIECGAYGAVMSRVNNILVLAENVEIQALYNNYLDFAPYTSVEVYLPFYGSISLNTNECMGKQISIYYVIDFNEGTATSFILCDDTGDVLDTRTFNIAVDIPLSYTNMADIKRSDFMAGVGIGQQVIGNIATGKASKEGNIGTAVINAVTGLTGHITGNIPRMSKGNVASSTAAQYGPQNVSITITRPDTINSSLYNQIHGRPVEVEDILTEYIVDGEYLLCGDVHLTGFNTATSTEINMIEQALKTGVIG